MRRRKLRAVILASALITLDGTAMTIALPAIGRDLGAAVSQLQWIANAPLLVLAATLLPAGTLVDRYGRLRMMRIGLMLFVAASAAGALAWSGEGIIGARLAQGAGGALVLPAALALLREAHPEAGERTRLFGLWAAWTGAASAAGPLLAGVLVDVWSWRLVFAPTIALGLVATAMASGYATEAESPARATRVPSVAVAALTILLGAVAYLLIQAPRVGFSDGRLAAPAILAIASGATLASDRRRQTLFPRELLQARNCLPANGTTFALYFGMFGLSFLLVLYVQQVLHYSALWAAIVLLPISIMLLFAERFGKLTSFVGTRPLVLSGALVAAAGIGWMGSGTHPIPFWTHIMVGTALFGLGISLAVSALTHAAVAAVPETCAGAASGLNHAVVRAAGLAAVALLGSLAAPGISDALSAEGFQRAMLVCAAIVAGGGLAGSALLRDHEPGGLSVPPGAE